MKARIIICIVVILYAFLAYLPSSIAADTALPLPRFASLKSDQVNLRAGPASERYPIEWVFLRRGLPVEITVESGTWRKIRDMDGAAGWVHQSMLSGNRTVLVLGETRPIYHDPDERSKLVVRLEAGVVASLKTCQPSWCLVEVGRRKGWIKREWIWGVYPEEFNTPNS